LAVAYGMYPWMAGSILNGNTNMKYQKYTDTADCRFLILIVILHTDKKLFLKITWLVTLVLSTNTTGSF